MPRIETNNTNITSNYREIWLPNYRIRWLIFFIVGGGGVKYHYEKLSVDDWTAELAIIASNGVFLNGAEVSVNTANSGLPVSYKVCDDT